MALGAATGRLVNRRALGSNVQWVDNGDEMLSAATGQLRSDMLGLAQAIAPGALRYPGGLMTDVFHWAAASNEHAFTRRTQPTRMDSRRLLELCEATGAAPLFSINLITGTAEEAADWVRAVNTTRMVSSRTGATLPRVDHWELGNEPYLKEASRPDLDLEPEAFAARANAAIRAMRAVDPSLRIGLPVSTEVRNGITVTAYPGYTRRVLAALTEAIDFISVHSGFLPLIPSAAGADAHYLATMAGTAALTDDIAAASTLVAQLRPGSSLPVALTEFAPTLGAGATDAWTLSPAGALYMADALRVLVDLPQLLMAHSWSLSGNGYFGAINQSAFLRPVGQVLQLANRAFQGEVMALQLSSDTTATPSVGLVPARSSLPLIEGLACRSGNTLRLWLVHKDRSRPAELSFSLGNLTATASSLVTLAGDNPLVGSDSAGVMRQVNTNPGAGSRWVLRLPAASVGLFEATLSG